MFGISCPFDQNSVGVIDLRENGLDGELSDLSALRNMTKLNVFNNYLKGSLGAANLASLALLNEVDVRFNAFSSVSVAVGALIGRGCSFKTDAGLCLVLDDIMEVRAVAAISFHGLDMAAGGCAAPELPDHTAVADLTWSSLDLDGFSGRLEIPLPLWVLELGGGTLSSPQGLASPVARGNCVVIVGAGWLLPEQIGELDTKINVLNTSFTRALLV
jgi:hypothetical protein